jgi:RimJ/RimL family protein N-acetyltransferase
MTEPIQGNGLRLRRATEADVDFLASLAVSDHVAPFLAAASASDPDAFLEEIDQAAERPHERGRFVIEAEVETRLWPAGSIAFETVNRRSRIAHLYGLMLHPDFRGRGIAKTATELFWRHLLTELNFHRVELECYGYDDRAVKHFERSGFVREGTKRRAYWRNGEWVDGILFGLVREDVEKPA